MTRQEQEIEIVRRVNKYGRLGNEAVIMAFISCLADSELDGNAVKRMILNYLDTARITWDYYNDEADAAEDVMKKEKPKPKSQ